MSFSQNGYCTVPLFRPDEIAGLRAVIGDHMDRVARALHIPNADTAPGAPYDERIERIAQHDQSCAQLLASAVATDAHRAGHAAALAEDRRLTEAAEHILGARVTGRTVRFRGNSSTLSAARQHWHSDVSRLDGGVCTSVRLAAWIPLIDAGPDSGGLEMAKGMRTEPLPHDAVPGKFNIADELLADCEKDQPTVPAGSCLFMDRFTPHRALPNLTGKTRWSLVVWMKA